MQEPSSIEQEIRAHWDGGRLEKVAELAIETYGGEVFAFLAARLGSASDAAEVFSIVSENLWVALPKFEWRCSMRGWFYTLARNGAVSYRRSPHNRADRRATLSRHGSVSALVDRVRSETLMHHRSEVKSRMRRLREQLPEADQTLLMLRIDRDLPWRELAMVMHDGETNPDDTELEQLSARLRQRLKSVKQRLKTLATEDGLI